MKLGLGLGVNSITSQKIGAGFTGFLDGVSGVIHAWSTVLLKSGVTDGTDLRRSSDDAEDTFGYAQGILDESGIESFVGGGNGFNKTLYDQVGNLDLTQGTDSRQPQLVSAGEMNKIDGTPFMSFDFTDDTLSCGTLGLNNSGIFSFDLDVNLVNVSSTTARTIFCDSPDGSNTFGITVWNSRLYIESLINSTSTYSGGYINVSNGRNKITVSWNNGTITAAFINGSAVSIPSATVGWLGTRETSSFSFGSARNLPSVARPFDGEISTLIFYDEAKDLAHHQAFNSITV